MQKESNELGAMIWKLQFGDDEMSIETHTHMKGEEIPELELSTGIWWMLLWDPIMHKASILIWIYIQKM